MLKHMYDVFLEVFPTNGMLLKLPFISMHAWVQGE